MITTPCSRVFDHWSIIETCAARALPTHPASCSIKILPILALHGYLHGYGSIPTIEPSDHPLGRQKSRSGPQCVPQLPKHTRASRARKHASTQRTQAREARQHASTQVHTACASTPVKHESPHPAPSHAHVPKNMRKSPTCAGSGPLWFPLLHLVTPGSYTGAGIHGGSPGDGLLGTDHGPKTSKKPACVNMCKQARQIRHGCSGPDVPGCLCSEEAAPRR